MSLRSVAKHSVEQLLCRSGITRVARRYRVRDALVLAYHNVAPDGAPATGDASLHLPRQEFVRQIELLQRTHDVVPLEGIFHAPRGRKPRAVITFDDAYEGAVSIGVPELVQRGLPATIFVAPAFLGGRSFWWDALGADGLSDAVRAEALYRFAGRDDLVRAWAARERLPLRTVPGYQTAASLDALRGAASDGLIRFASHTWSHPNLARLSRAEVESELVRSREWLEAHLPGFIPWISYPYGLSTPDVEDVAARTGYEGAFRVDGGWIRGPSPLRPSFSLPRLNVPSGVSIGGFHLRVSGLERR